MKKQTKQFGKLIFKKSNVAKVNYSERIIGGGGVVSDSRMVCNSIQICVNHSDNCTTRTTDTIDELGSDAC